MADTTFAAGAANTQWSADYLAEYNRDSEYASWMGGVGSSKPIQLFKDLMAQPGHTVTFSWLARLTGDGAVDDAQLENNEEDANDYVQSCTTHQYRNAIKVAHYEKGKGAWDLLNARRPSLKEWSQNLQRGHINTVLLSPNLDGATAYASTAEGDKDLWMAANTDRVLFGALIGNQSASDHSNSLLTVDTTDDTFTRAKLMLMRRLASAADPYIQPVKVKNFGDYWACFAGTLNFRDMETDLGDNIWAQSQVRGEGNALYKAGDMIYRGTVIREVPTITPITGVGDTSADVGQVLLSGAAAVAMAWEEKPHPIEDDFDYGNGRGIGIAEIRGQVKHIQNSVQVGLVTGYFAATADA